MFPAGFLDTLVVALGKAQVLPVSAEPEEFRPSFFYEFDGTIFGAIIDPNNLEVLEGLSS